MMLIKHSPWRIKKKKKEKEEKERKEKKERSEGWKEEKKQLSTILLSKIANRSF